MFPRSKRPARKFEVASRTIAKSTAVQAGIAAQTASAQRVLAHDRDRGAVAGRADPSARGHAPLTPPRFERELSAARPRARRADARTATISERATRASRGLERRRVAAPGGDEHRERDEPQEPEPRLRERDDDEQKREVVQPDDRRQRERGGEREEERGSLVATPAEDDDRRERARGR